MVLCMHKHVSTHLQTGCHHVLGMNNLCSVQKTIIETQWWHKNLNLNLTIHAVTFDYFIWRSKAGCLTFVFQHTSS